MKELPDKPSELILLALDDLKKVEQLPDEFKVDMGSWVDWREDGKCAVCLAGAVMTQSLGTNRMNDMDVPSCFDPTIADKLSALDEFRCGRVRGGLCDMRITPTDEILNFQNTTRYQDSPTHFHKDMMEIVKHLQAHNL